MNAKHFNKSEAIEDAIDNVFNTTEVQNGTWSSSKVNFSAKIDFSIDNRLKITEIHNINRIESVDLKEEIR